MFITHELFTYNTPVTPYINTIPKMYAVQPQNNHHKIFSGVQTIYLFISVTKEWWYRNSEKMSHEIKGKHRRFLELP